MDVDFSRDYVKLFCIIKKGIRVKAISENKEISIYISNIHTIIGDYVYFSNGLISFIRECKKMKIKWIVDREE